MGYPDDWTKYGIIKNDITPVTRIMDTITEISDTQRYKMCGNGVVSNVVAEIVKKLICG